MIPFYREKDKEIEEREREHEEQLLAVSYQWDDMEDR